MIYQLKCLKWKLSAFTLNILEKRISFTDLNVQKIILVQTFIIHHKIILKKYFFFLIFIFFNVEQTPLSFFSNRILFCFWKFIRDHILIVFNGISGISFQNLSNIPRGWYYFTNKLLLIFKSAGKKYILH